ncbi:hypothetical protein D3C71_1603290 [compost metagenome]
MFITLHQHIAATCVFFTFGDDRHFRTFIALRVFSAVDKAAQIALFHPAESVGFFFNLDGVAERCQRRLRQRKVNVMTQGLDVDQQIALGGRGQPFAQRGEWLQLFCALTAGKVVPDVIAKGDHRTQMRIGKLLLQLGQRLAKLLAALAQIGEFALHGGFHKNGEAAVFQ